MKFEKIVELRSENECNECFRIMAYLYSKTNNKLQARKYYELAKKYFPHDIELLVEYALFLEMVELKDAIKIYEKIMELIKSDPTVRPKPELFNNYAVTLIKSKKFDEAKIYLEKAFQINQGQQHDPTLEFFLRFNRGILYEEKGLFSSAKQEFLQLIETNPIVQGTAPMTRTDPQTREDQLPERRYTRSPAALRPGDCLR